MIICKHFFFSMVDTVVDYKLEREKEPPLIPITPAFL